MNPAGCFSCMRTCFSVLSIHGETTGHPPPTLASLKAGLPTPTSDGRSGGDSHLHKSSRNAINVNHCSQIRHASIPSRFPRFLSRYLAVSAASFDANHTSQPQVERPLKGRHRRATRTGFAGAPAPCGRMLWHRFVPFRSPISHTTVEQTEPHAYPNNYETSLPPANGRWLAGRSLGVRLPRRNPRHHLERSAAWDDRTLVRGARTP